MGEWWSLVLGPAGALVLAVSLAGVLLRQVSASHRRECERLRGQLANEQARSAQMWESLQASQQARLQSQQARLEDAKRASVAMMQVLSELHQTVERLEQISSRRGRRS